ncbi:hypothetical protein [Adhaeretor mobilis]|uniref:hypothetical protein n=1 Tax=Adhaeretor mobilis TaxID=1930276 RepID=UPI0011A2FA67|nr:hypothetical protein [Adhaeretor mobilis]
MNQELILREVALIRFKRIHIQPGGEDKAGHWWFEIGDPNDTNSESYGWWPASPLDSLFHCLKGVDGKLNNGLFGCAPARDPHHAEAADEEFSPLVAPEDGRSDDDVADCLRLFANDYRGKWQWFLGWGKNCHNFQRAALKHCGLEVPSNIRRIKL